MIKAIVTDIEGTTSSISFVHQVLFPYAREHMADFITERSDTAAVREQLLAVNQEVGRVLSDEQAIAQLLEWIDQDKKITPLKALQGMIWQEGYEKGAYQGHVYEDAYQQLNAWFARGIQLYVYSSGSVKAQQLLFSHTAFGDMTPIFNGYFDTRVGGKRESASYQRIAQQIGLAPEQILFLSDIDEELLAAQCVGMEIALLKRVDGEGSSQRHVYASFLDINL